MRLGVCLSLFDERILLLPALGADYAEIGLSELASVSGEAVLRRGEVLKQAGVRCGEANLLFPGTLRLLGPEADPEAVAAYLADVLPKAEALGVRRVTFGSGGTRRLPKGLGEAEALKALSEMCRRVIAPAFERRGMVCCLEPLRREECDLLRTCREGADFVRAVDRPSLRLLVDLYHLDCEGEPRSSLAGYGGLLCHAHIASAKNGRNIPRPGDGEDYAEFFDALAEAGYTGDVSLEGNMGADFSATVQRSLEFLRGFSRRFSERPA